MMQITLSHYLILSLIVFILAFMGIIASKNLIKTLILVEVMMSAININFIAFTAFKNYISLSGMVFALFVTVISVLQIALGLFIIYLVQEEDKEIKN